jgi:large subunit ribosomal protein L5
MQRFNEFYNNIVVPSLINKFNYKNYYQIPKILKIKLVFSVNADKPLHNQNVLVSLQALKLICYGSSPSIVKDSSTNSYSKKNYTNCETELKGLALHNFLNRLITIDLPSLKFFKGFSFSSKQEIGSYCLSIYEPIAFSDLGEEYLKFSSLEKLDIIFFTNCTSLLECKTLFAFLQIPLFYKNDTNKDKSIG